ncbi:hypothetical protein [Scytonema sp. NUACC26]|uniref:hypothetical protein n=1 Tax=Scytonema sp. NUACC26 TaxID=3140176 RepID=UPI0034DCC38E
MRSLMYSYEKYISPNQIVIYLEKSGWNKIKEAEGISAWIYSKEDKKMGIFVPLIDDFVDYRERILEVLDTLEEIERRSKYEIIQDIVNRSKIEREH